jgi:hypothetical protein
VSNEIVPSHDRRTVDGVPLGHFSTAAGDGCADATIEVRSRQIANLYDAHRRGAYGEAEWERQESGIIAASRKGRVRDAEPVNGWISK